MVESRMLANAIRVLSMDAVQAANSGHPGMPMGMADVATVLFTRFLSFDPSCPDWPDRDRFVLSAGHGCMLLYSLLWLTGYEEVELDHLRTFRQLGSPAAGHPALPAQAALLRRVGPHLRRPGCPCRSRPGDFLVDTLACRRAETLCPY